MPTPPALSDEQRQAALDKAAESRQKVAEFKKRLDRGEEGDDIIGILGKMASDPVLTRMRVTQFLQALPGIGKVKALDIMEHVGVASNRRVGGLGVNQRMAIAAAIAKRIG